MNDILQIVQAASQDPQFDEAMQTASQQLDGASTEQVDELTKLLEFALQHSDKYAEIRQAAIQDDMADPEDLPEQFDATFIISLLVVLYRLRSNGSAQPAAMARGGLSRLAAQGRMGDTMLAHISPDEARMLKRMGGAGTINRATGLPQFLKLKDFLKVAAPIALSFIAPGIGTAIGATLGASGVAATMLGSAVIGGVMSGLTGGNVLQGALLGGLTGGLGDYIGGGLSEQLGLNLGSTGQSILGGSLVGGAAGALTGKGFGQGALMGAAGAALGAAGQDIGEGALRSGIGSGSRLAGSMLTAGFNPRQALLSGALSGLATSLTYKPPELGAGLKPSQAAVEGLKAQPGLPAEFDRTGTTNFLTGQQGIIPGQAPTLATLPQPSPGMESDLGGGLRTVGNDLLPTNVGQATGVAPNKFEMPGMKTLGALALASSLSSQRPPEVNDAIQKLSPQQQEYFNRPSVQWDWNRMQNDANAMNMSLGEYMANYWPQITGGGYNVVVKKAAGGLYGMGGGALGTVARLVRGGGSGRDDTIDARLSDGEYVMDAETVAMLGDGSTDEGARRLDSMRAQLRKHKGRALSRGKFSPNAKSPLAYLKGAA